MLKKALLPKNILEAMRYEISETQESDVCTHALVKCYYHQKEVKFKFSYPCVPNGWMLSIKPNSK